MADDSPFTIEISDEQQILAVDHSMIEETVLHTLWVEDVQSANIVVALFNDASIHQVNRDFLNHDYPTDVISFLYASEKPLRIEGEIDRASGNAIDGELVVSVETAAREAKNCGWRPVDELRLYVVHGLLHLCGYDDLTEAEQAIMRNREREILKIWNLTPNYQ